jgi:hypothetical protein
MSKDKKELYVQYPQRIGKSAPNRMCSIAPQTKSGIQIEFICLGNLK